MALAVSLYKKGVLDDDDVAVAAVWLSEKAESETGDSEKRLYEAAQLMACVPLEAAEISEGDFAAERARSRFRVIDGDAPTS